MSNVIQFPVKKKENTTVNRMLDFSRAVDSAVRVAIAEGLEPQIVAGLLANRLKAVCEAATKSTGKDILAIVKEKIL